MAHAEIDDKPTPVRIYYKAKLDSDAVEMTAETPELQGSRDYILLSVGRTLGYMNAPLKVVDSIVSCPDEDFASAIFKDGTELELGKAEEEGK